MSKFLFKQKITKFDPYITKLTEAECLRISLKSALIFPLILNHNWLSSNQGAVTWSQQATMAKLLAKHQSYCQAQVIFKNEVKRIITHISYFTHEIILHLKIHPEFPGKKHFHFFSVPSFSQIFYCLISHCECEVRDQAGSSKMLLNLS